MRVLHAGKYFPPYRGGMETALRALCEDHSGEIVNDVLVANVTMRTVVERVGAVDVVRAGTLLIISSIPFCPTFPYWMRKRRADLVNLHEPNPTALLSYLLVRPPGRLIIWFHSQIIGRPLFSAFYDPLLKRALQIADRIVVASPTMRDHPPALAPFKDKCVVIPYGIDSAVIARSGAQDRASSIRQTVGGPIVLFTGRLTYYKGVDYLIAAMQMVAATLIIAGEGPGRGALEHQVRNLGLQQRVRFAGELSDDDLRAHYHACDVFVLPSVELSEAFGIVQLEAMAAGKPVVSTNLATGISWVNQDGVTGIVVPPRDSESLARAINELLNDADKRIRYGRQGQERVEAEFTEALMRRRAAAVYREVLHGDSAPVPPDHAASCRSGD